jgi:hypothetical protein
LVGDLDCDGDLDFDDIAPLVLGLNDPIAYEDIFGLSPRVKGDVDGDGDLDFDDIPAFISLLSGQAAGRMQRIPEPRTLVLSALSIVVLSCWRCAHPASQPNL